VLIRVPQGYFQLGAVQWTLHPLSLLTLSPHLTVRSEWGRQILNAELIVRGPQDLDVFNLDAQVAASLLGQFAPVVVSGQFSLQAELLQVRDGMTEAANGRLVWQNAVWDSPRGSVPLGSYALDFQQAEGEPLQGQVLTLAGPLQASGSLQLQQRRYNVDVQLSSEGALEAQMQQMLSLIAQPEDGGYRLNLSGDL
jgi:general secretion pathway protein N